MGNHVFICYAREDQAFTLALASCLKERGIPIWLDRWSIQPGEDWDQAIDKALDDCAQFLIVLSPQALTSREVRGELRSALDADKPILPIVYQTCQLPRQLRTVQYVDFTSRGPEAETALKEVERTLGGRTPVPLTEKNVPLGEPSRVEVTPAPPPSKEPPPVQQARRGWLSWFTMPQVRIAFSLSISFAVLFFAVAYLLPGQNVKKQDLPAAVPPPPPPVAAVIALLSRGEMVSIPAGKFWMGCNETIDKNCDDDEKPGHEVFLDAYSIDQYEVTVAEYRQCVEAKGKGCTPPGTDSSCNWGESDRDKHPVNCVDWAQARAYGQWAGKRLPTEAEWEKAARGDKDQRIYPWGNEWDANKANAGRSGTVPVGSHTIGVSPYKVDDMTGNVFEWVQDWYDQAYYKRGVTQNPKGPDTGIARSVRGGSWFDLPRSSRVSDRLGGHPGNRGGFVGFRCAQ